MWRCAQLISVGAVRGAAEAYCKIRTLSPTASKGTRTPPSIIPQLTSISPRQNATSLKACDDPQTCTHR